MLICQLLCRSSHREFPGNAAAVAPTFRGLLSVPVHFGCSLSHLDHTFGRSSSVGRENRSDEFIEYSLVNDFDVQER